MLWGTSSLMLATPLTLFPSEAESPDSLCFQGTWKVPAQPQPCAAKDKKQSITGIPDTIQGVGGVAHTLSSLQPTSPPPTGFWKKQQVMNSNRSHSPSAHFYLGLSEHPLLLLWGFN